MFTGIIQEVGRVERVDKKGHFLGLGVKSSIIYEASQPSDSVSINGVCLTVVKKDKGILFFEAVQATLENTNIKRLKKNGRVNLEPALKVGEKLGGHFVLGHIDAEARLLHLDDRRGYWRLEVELLSLFRKSIIENGSVSIDGVSLTVKKIFSKSFTADIIPFTYSHTIMQYRKPGDWLNLEFDYLLKGKSK
ncbi:MAG: riboflavin synthase [Candidatus Omnitrophica bacterium]|nr:riboflavin synthase [Candidatus Omnitrophota bacterium]MDD5429543.1 riboflavin synthase [Candidatus Omnitrophota bacterium]